jgi:putative membrane protein
VDADFYLWIKALHIIAVIAWMAGLLYLPRLFVYHCEADHGSDRAAMLEVMERRLLWAIMTPAMVVVVISAVALLWLREFEDFSDGWLHAKLVLVVGLAVAHGLMARWRKDFASGANHHSQRFYRIANEVPTLLMIGIVVLVVVKPF